MSRIGVVGAGVMGVGVAQNVVQSGHSAVLVDVDQDTVDSAIRQIERNLRFSRMLGGDEVDTVAALAAISPATKTAALADVDYVIENITENWDLKSQLYRQLAISCKADTVFIVNTSAIPITRIAALTGRPEQVIGVHFMNPVPMKKVVELIPGMHTAAATVERTRALLDSLGKRPVQVRDSCGFVSNRVLMLTINEAAFLVHEGVADAAAVDEVFRGCFGHPMGPLETADLIGIDTILYSIEVLYEHYADSKYRPCPLLKEMTAGGLLGRKSGQGFHPYRSTRGQAHD